MGMPIPFSVIAVIFGTLILVVHDVLTSLQDDKLLQMISEHDWIIYLFSLEYPNLDDTIKVLAKLYFEMCKLLILPEKGAMLLCFNSRHSLW